MHQFVEKKPKEEPALRRITNSHQELRHNQIISKHGTKGL